MARILVVEDEAVLRMLISDSLEDEGYEIETANDGHEALTNIQTNTYDLIIVDHMMPRMTGLEVISAIRGSISIKNNIKILMLSAKSQSADREKALKTGADVFLSKPFSPMELVHLVGEMLNE